MLILQLCAAGALPIAFTFVFYLLEKKNAWIQHLDNWSRQILVGICYGLLACLASQFGIPYEDQYILNARAAAPITAGLIYGVPAGVIASVMGALFRAISVFWGLGLETWLSCTLSTLFSGLIAGGCYQFVFEKKRPEWYHGLFIGISCEVTHMLLVFLTHINNEQRAFEIVNNCAIPMIIVNSVSVALSLLMLSLLNRDQLFPKRKDQKLSRILALKLYIVMIIAYLVTSIFTYNLQTNICMRNAKDLLTRELMDTEEDIIEISNGYYSDIVNDINILFDKNSVFWEVTDADQEEKKAYLDKLKTIVFAMKIYRLSILNENREVILQTGDMNQTAVLSIVDRASKEDSLCATENHNNYDLNSVGYIGVCIPNRGYVVATYTKGDFHRAVSKGLLTVASKRHAGKTGYTFLLDKVSQSPLSLPNKIGKFDLKPAFDCIGRQTEMTLFNLDMLDNTEFACMYKSVENCIIYAAIPMKEVMYNRNITVYLTAFLLHETFSILFIAAFILVKHNVVDDLHIVNKNLNKIGDGNLDTRVRVYSCVEFVELSEDINDTVIALNRYIEEANSRIDAELVYARTIQSSLLPSTFPAFPNRSEIDIFAKMKPAKEVGGDFYDFSFLDNETLMFTVADVSGKGIPAAMFMMRVRTLIKSYAETGKKPGELVSMANEELVHYNEAEMFVTLWIGYLNLRTGILTYVNGGHNPPVLIRKGQKPEFLRTRSGMVLGGLEGINYRELELSLNEGDQIFLYTDGVTEAFNEEGDQYGEDRLLSILDKVKHHDSSSICDKVKEHMNAFIQGAAQFDDITMLNIQYLHQISNKEEN